MKRKRVVILGATGSIGESALKVARDIPERMEIVGLAAKGNAQKLAAAANEVRPESVCLVDETQIEVLRKGLEYTPRIFSGEAGLVEIARLTNADMVLVAIVGTGGLRPALAAIKAGRDLAVASKEILVMAGEIVMREACNRSVNVLPVDSEHNAIFQCLAGQNPAAIKRIHITCSGGPFLNYTADQMSRGTSPSSSRSSTSQTRSNSCRRSSTSTSTPFKPRGD